MGRGRLLLPVGLLALVAAAPIGAQPGDGAQRTGTEESAEPETRAPAVEAPESVRCISVSSIDRTEVIDNRTIAFFLRGGRVYLNTLNRACRNLRPGRPFSYQTSTGQLCAIDTITVIEDFGPGLNNGDTCGLGAFVPSDEEEVEILQGEREPVEVEAEEIEVEEIEVEEAEPGE